MGFNLRCPHCLRESQRNNAPTPCPRHAATASPDPEMAAARAMHQDDRSPRFRPTADNPFPFTSLEYARLLLLRSRLRDRGYPMRGEHAPKDLLPTRKKPRRYNLERDMSCTWCQAGKPCPMSCRCRCHFRRDNRHR